MKISELMTKLEYFKKENGDLEVRYFDDYSYETIEYFNKEEMIENGANTEILLIS